jgi:hypothetical protein
LLSKKNHSKSSTLFRDDFGTSAEKIRFSGLFGVFFFLFFFSRLPQEQTRLIGQQARTGFRGTGRKNCISHEIARKSRKPMGRAQSITEFSFSSDSRGPTTSPHIVTMVDASIEIATEEDVTAHFGSSEDTVAALFTQHDEVEDIPDSLHIYSETREPIASKLEKMLRYGVNPAAVAQQLSLLSNKGEGRVENIETRLLPGSGALQCHGEKISKPHLAEHVDNSNYVECTICFETLSVNSLHAMTSVHLVRPCKFR